MRRASGRFAIKNSLECFYVNFSIVNYSSLDLWHNKLTHKSCCHIDVYVYLENILRCRADMVVL